MSLLGIISGRRSGYNVWKLVNRRIFAGKKTMAQPFQIISDIDKTYLDTAFETFSGLAKIAIETADEKKSIDGARYFLRHLKWDVDCHDSGQTAEVPLHFVSSSPPQLRQVLEEKISMDGLTWASDSFKDQIYNLKKGKISLLKHQVGYKMASILSLCAKFHEPKKILLIGDNAETDPYIYMLIKGFLTKQIDEQECIQLLGKLDVSKKIGDQIFHELENPRFLSDVPILIRKIKGKPSGVPTEFKNQIFYFEDYFQASIISHSLGLINLHSLLNILVGMHNFHNYQIQRGFRFLKFYIEENNLNDEFAQVFERDLRLKKIFKKIEVHDETNNLIKNDIDLVLFIKNNVQKTIVPMCDQKTFSNAFRNWLANNDEI